MYELSAVATILKSLPLDIYALSVHLQLKKKKKKRQKQVLISDLAIVSRYLYSPFQLLPSRSPILISLAVSKHVTWTELSRKITVWRIKMATYQQILSRL